MAVLIVEDDPTQQKVLAMLVEKAGSSFYLANSASQALQALDHYGDIDLVLMDYRMSDVDGIECTRRIRARERGCEKRIPVVAVTAYASRIDRESCLAAGMDDYLSKPFSIDAFTEIVHHWLKISKTADREVQLDSRD